MIRLPSYISRNQYGIYHFRIAIPRSLRPYFQKREIKRSLGTSDRREAIRFSRLMAIQVNNLFLKANNGDMSNKHGHPMHLTLKGIKKNPDGSIEIAEVEMDPDKKEDEAQLFQNAIDSLSPPVPKAPTIKPPPIQTIVLDALLEEYVAEKVREESWTPKTQLESEGAFNLLVQIIGNVSVNTIGFEQARDYQNVLKKLPPNLKKSPLYRSKSIEEIIALKPSKLMEINTINKHVSRVSAFFGWAKKRGYVNDNYFSGLTLKNKKQPHEERNVFSNQDLSLIFSTEIFTENKHLHHFYYWLPLIALFTGARIEEICQLHLDDIWEENGIWVFDINEDLEKKLKTSSSKRLIPVHSKLIDLGILKYASSLRSKKKTRLFPELKHQRDGYSQAASKWFGRWREKNGLTEDGKTFHSFRHTVGNTLKQKEIPEKQVAAILGHSGKSMTFDRYGKPFKPSVLQPVIEQLDFDSELASVKKW
jgi:integrase